MTLLDLAADHLWQSSAVAIVVGLLALACRRCSAQVRYGLWLAASAKFLVPFAALVALGSQFGWLLPVASAPHASFVVITERVSAAVLPLGIDTAATVARLPGGEQTWMLPLVLAGIWAAGAAVVLAIWLLRWRRVARLVRAAARVERGRERAILRRVERQNARGGPIPLVLSDAPREPGVFGILRPVLLWPRRISERLDDEQIAVILAHELAHVRRHDNLAAAAHTAVQALFWFHPLVWWIGARLVAERERACDEAVIRQSRRPRLYAESLLATSRCCVELPLSCVAGVTGSNLTQRVEAIMRHDIGLALTLWKKTALAAAGTLALAVPVAVGVVTAPRLGAQAPSEDPADRPAFEVASVRPNESNSGMVRIGLQPGGRYNATNVTLRFLVRNAYRLQGFQIIGGPDWIDSARFDVVAKAEGDPPPPPPGQVGTLQLMIRSLLADRFKLAAHMETRELPMYALVLARDDGRLGPQLTRSTVDCQALRAGARRGGPLPNPPRPGERPNCGIGIRPGTMAAGGFPLSEFATTLSGFVERIVVDRTGLTGNFDLELRWTPDQLPGGFGAPPPGAPALPPIDPDGPSLFTALQEQLGLKLEADRGPVDVLVIDGAEMPTPD